MIKVTNLKKSYGDKKKVDVLKGLDLCVEKGEMVAIMGKSGSGKSTLLNILAGLDRSDAGCYTYHDDEISNKTMSELAHFRREKIGFILQNYPLIDTKTVLENVALPLIYSKVPKKESEKKAEEVLTKVGIEYLKDRWVDALSGGEAQRVAIARALIQDPELLLADEPTGSLDEETEKEILDLCLELNRQGKTFIVVTHDSEVAAICDKIYRMKDGKCVLENGCTEG